jgi:3-oxoacyl-[acyl-carrier-protein] synthase II
LSPGIAFNTFNHITACEIARALDVQGPIQTVSNGCNSGADAIGLAFDWIRLGRAKVVLAGGTENEIAPTFFKAMHACRALSTAHNARPGESSRPFDTKRDGNVPGEGAGFLILEDLDHALQRGAEIKAVISSYVSTASGERQYNPFNPDLSPRHIIRNMTLALEQAGITEKDLSAISANGSSSLLYDAIESAAIESLYQSAQRKIPVFSIKGGLGQTGACTSAFQVLAAAMSVHTGLIPPTINVQQLDSECRINLNVGKALEMPVKHILCNAIGFGGFYYTSLVISRPPYANR